MRTEFPIISEMTLSRLLPFGITLLLQSAFLILTIIKSKCCSIIKHTEDALILLCQYPGKIFLFMGNKQATHFINTQICVFLNK